MGAKALVTDGGEYVTGVGAGAATLSLTDLVSALESRSRAQGVLSETRLPTANVMLLALGLRGAAEHEVRGTNRKQ